MSFKSVNPKNGKLVKSFENLSNRVLQDKMELSFKTYRFMKNQGPSGLHERMAKFEKVKQLMSERKQNLAELETTEMGKPIKESVGEVDKSIAMIDFFNKNTEKYMEEESIPSKYKGAVVVQQPWGPSLSKMIRTIKYRYSSLELPYLAPVQDWTARIDSREPCSTEALTLNTPMLQRP